MNDKINVGLPLNPDEKRQIVDWVDTDTGNGQRISIAADKVRALTEGGRKLEEILAQLGESVAKKLRTALTDPPLKGKRVRANLGKKKKR